MIRMPDFVTEEEFYWAVEAVVTKKNLDGSRAEFMTIEEGLCAQMMYIGPFEKEPETVKRMETFR